MDKMLKSSLDNIVSASNNKKIAVVESLVNELSKPDIHMLIMYMQTLGYDLHDVLNITQFLQE